VIDAVALGQVGHPATKLIARRPGQTIIRHQAQRELQQRRRLAGLAGDIAQLLQGLKQCLGLGKRPVFGQGMAIRLFHRIAVAAVEQPDQIVGLCLHEYLRQRPYEKNRLIVLALDIRAGVDIALFAVDLSDRAGRAVDKSLRVPRIDSIGCRLRIVAH